jgi:hypothetical protein
MPKKALTSDLCKDTSKAELIQVAKTLYPYYTRLNSMSKRDLCTISHTDCSNKSFALANKNNSCYLDSIIVGLFHNQNNHVKQIFLNSPVKAYNKSRVTSGIADAIQIELRHIAAELSVNDPLHKRNNTKYCTNLRRLFQSYQRAYSNNVFKMEDFDWKYSQAEPFDFVRFMQVMFEIPTDVIRVRHQLWGTNSVKRTVILKHLDSISDYTREPGFVFIVDLEDLIGADVVNLGKMLPMRRSDTFLGEDNMWNPTGNQSYKRKIEKTTYLEGKLLMVHVNRMAFQEKLDASIIAPLKIKMRHEKTPLYLRSMIIHHGDGGGGHYTCLYECKGVWYHYDDMESRPKKIGSFEQVEAYKQAYYLRNCTDLIYT